MAQLETLLEQMVEQNETLIARVTAILDAVEEIKHSVDWTNDGSAVKQIVTSLQRVEDAVAGLQ